MSKHKLSSIKHVRIRIHCGMDHPFKQIIFILVNETDPRSYGLLGDISVGSTGVESDGQTEGPMNGKMVTG